MEQINQPDFFRKDGKLNLLLREILAHRLQPENHYEIAAILESFGWNDARAAEEFGVENVFDLAADLWDIVEKNIRATYFSPDEKMKPLAYFWMVFRSFMRGMIFALPMAVSVLSMLTLRFSLWSYVNLTLEVATSIAIGTIMSFMTVGGFMQAIARRGYMYIKQGYFNLARKITFYYIKLGYVAVVVIVLMYLFVNTVFDIFPYRMTFIVVLYFFFLTAIWLSVTVMCIMEKELAFTGLLATGIFIVYIFFVVLKLDIILSQVIALIFVTVTGILLTRHFFVSAEKKMERGISLVLPRTSITIYTILPYFAYGFLYFTFLFADRVIAWSTNDVYMPYLIWFRGPYELGLDLALLTLILSMGFIEVIVNEIMYTLEVTQKDFLIMHVQLFRKKFLEMYIRRFIVITILSLASSLGVYYFINNISAIAVAAFEIELLTNSTTHFVFIVALVAYALLTIALMNALILFSLSQPEMISKAMLIGLVVDLVVGFPLSRWFDYSYAIFGLLAGVVVFLAISTKRVINVLNKLEFYLYASS